jgi:hypothetical protein
MFQHGMNVDKEISTVFVRGQCGFNHTSLHLAEETSFPAVELEVSLHSDGYKHAI